jgi:pyruvate formate lyase activating enzyme
VKIGGFLKNSFIDFPGKISSVVFTQGCNFRCHYCHNPELVIPEAIIKNGSFPEHKIFDYLNSRKGKIEAVVVTGGEPTLHIDLPDFIRKIKQMNFLVKLDTNGTNPSMLKHLINEGLIDYAAMDIKAPLDLSRYREIAGKDFTEAMLSKIKESFLFLKEGHCEYEFRTTASPDFLSMHDLKTIIMNSIPFNHFSLQNFNSDNKLLDNDYKNKKSFSNSELKKLQLFFKDLDIEIK